jgi:outer membrane immunogenic protein
LALCFVTVPVVAADLPSLSTPPVMPPSPPASTNWTGLYVGVNGGGGLDHFAFPFYTDLFGNFEKTSSGISSKGAVLGGQIGYNYQLTNLPIIGHAVAGVEVDSDWASLTGSTTVNTLASGPATFTTRFENFGTARLRLGYDFDRLLVFFTGGLSYGTTRSSYNFAGFSNANTDTHTGLPPHVGVVGIGAEYALTNNFSIKAEYLYDFIRDDFVTFTTPTSQVGFGTRSMYHIARIGLNYKLDLFSPPVPVIAKY